MRFIVSQKILSFADSFVIYDEIKNPMYKVMGKLFAFGDQLTLCDMNGVEKLYINQKIFKLLPEYHLFQNNRCMATIKKEFTFFKPRFTITSDCGNYTIAGNFLGYNFSIQKDGYEVARVSKEFFAIRDSYIVDIQERQDEVLLLAMCIVIDQTLHDNNRNNN